ncbi:MAG: MmcQ/YjbR family DNA-binding protein [Gammaproteobacteria bacterium]|nr:MmcQ/YjbR family DNA-binding protein [Gammaproteobacteria bacterium]MYF27796.1 MmcQ/YjbR family DNA-binding protein [Gammaproteobacteria bacterium]MYK45710.1 MmcQ/YjbR family DNA-binding protein [Gammaproteobacteria bacterium]
MAREPVPIKFPPNEALAARYAQVLEIAQRFPGVEASRSYGTPAIKVKRKLLARLRSEAEGGLAIVCDFVDREMLLQAAPETFYITDHYADWPMVLINLETVRWDAMPDILERAWRSVAAPSLIKEYEASATGSGDPP